MMSNSGFGPTMAAELIIAPEAAQDIDEAGLSQIIHKL